MKKRRQEAILEIIEKYDLSTQDELLQKLKDSGFDATQATVSRDIVIRCYTGMAQAACAAFDSMHWEGLVGTLAGDDTIFALCRSESYASQMKDSIKRLIEK